MKEGVYHGQRPVRGLGKPWRHEYVVACPKNKKGLSKDAKSNLKNVGGRKCLVAGAYGKMTGKNRKLRARLGDKVDTEYARSGAGLKKLSASNPTKSANKIAKRSKEFKPRPYPNVLQNVLGAKDNSNTYARALLKDLKHKKGHKRSIRNPGASREMKLESLQKILSL